MWQTLGSGRDAKTQIKAFLNNAANKQSVWTTMSDVLKESILGKGNTARFDLFQQKIDDISSNLYDFIEELI